jgi:hypothetical protein
MQNPEILVKIAQLGFLGLNMTFYIAEQMLHNSLLRGTFFKNREFDVSLLLICSSGLMML